MRSIFALVPISMLVAMFLICLSSEREEDEFVMHIRMGIIKKIICFWFVASLLRLIFLSVYFNLLSSEFVHQITLAIDALTDIYVLILVYIVWLKSKLSKLRKEAAHD